MDHGYFFFVLFFVVRSGFVFQQSAGDTVNPVCGSAAAAEYPAAAAAYH